VDSREARAMVQKDPANTVVVDVRRDDEWVTGHVTGAIHIPVDDLADQVGQLPTDKKVLFICAAGVRSGLACEIAASMGMDTENLYNIEDGTPKWIANRLPTSYGNNP
jgi:rhodanese-related sulfurtransferase